MSRCGWSTGDSTTGRRSPNNSDASSSGTFSGRGAMADKITQAASNKMVTGRSSPAHGPCGDGSRRLCRFANASPLWWGRVAEYDTYLVVLPIIGVLGVDQREGDKVTTILCQLFEHWDLGDRTWRVNDVWIGPFGMGRVPSLRPWRDKSRSFP